MKKNTDQEQMLVIKYCVLLNRPLNFSRAYCSFPVDYTISVYMVTTSILVHYVIIYLKDVKYLNIRLRQRLELKTKVANYRV